MPLVRLRPQWVEHSEEGWSVMSAGREAMAYVEPARRAEVGIDWGRPTTRVHLRSLAWVGPDGGEAPLTDDERALVWPRFVAGMEALGLHLEEFDG